MEEPYENETLMLLIFILIEYICANPRDLTYLGIGTYPNNKAVDDHLDQIIPVFVRERLDKTGDTVRIIHFDPRFKDSETSETSEALVHYFSVRGPKLGLKFNYYPEDGYELWISEDHRIEILFLKHHFDFADKNKFLEQLIDGVLRKNKKLIIQPFLGMGCDELASKYMKKFPPELFRRKILFDVTYGEDCGCSTDLTKYLPVYDASGDFINHTLFSAEELLARIDEEPRIRRFVEIRYRKMFNHLAATHIGNSRRRAMLMLGESVCEIYVSEDDGYTPEDHPVKMICCYEAQLMPLIPILDRIKLLTPKAAEIEALFARGKSLVSLDNFSPAEMASVAIPVSRSGELLAKIAATVSELYDWGKEMKMIVLKEV